MWILDNYVIEARNSRVPFVYTKPIYSPARHAANNPRNNVSADFVHDSLTPPFHPLPTLPLIYIAYYINIIQFSKVLLMRSRLSNSMNSVLAQVGTVYATNATVEPNQRRELACIYIEKAKLCPSITNRGSHSLPTQQGYTKEGVLKEIKGNILRRVSGQTKIRRK